MQGSQFPVNLTFSYYPVNEDNNLCFSMILDQSVFENIASQISKIMREISEEGLKLLDIRSANIPSLGKAILFLVLEVKTSEKTAILNRLSAIEGVKEIIPAKVFGNICYSTSPFPIEVLGNRWILIGPAYFNTMVFELKKIVGKQLDSFVLRELGRYVGRSIFDYYNLNLSQIDTVDKAVGFLSLLFELSGWGIIEGHELFDGGLRLSIKDQWEVVALQERHSQEKPRFTIGILEGYFSELMKRDIKVEMMSVTRREGHFISIFNVYY